MLLLFLKLNSIGSSIVIICLLKLSFIYCIIDAKVVDLPLPVGQVTRINHFHLFKRFFTSFDTFKFSNVGIFIGIYLIAIACHFESLKIFTLNLESSRA
jgi:hypothetical protein